MKDKDEEPGSRSTMTLKQAIDVYGAESSLVRHLNRNEVLRYLRASGEAHGISAIAKATDLSRPTVDLALSDLTERGLVTETAALSASSPRGGRPAREFRFAARSGCLAAVTLTSHELCVVVADLRDQVVGKARTTFADFNREPDPVESLGAAVDRAVAELSFTPEQLQVVVAGVRGVVSADGVVQTSGELPSLVGDEVHRRLRERFGCTVLVENDANLATLAEHRNLSGPADLVGLLIDDGIGCGLVLNGELYRGAHGAAGEFFGDDRTRPWVGTNAEIRRHAKRHKLTFTDVFAAAEAGRGPARTLVTRYAADVAELVRELLVLDPPVIVVGGEVVNAGDVFMDAFRKALAPALYSDTTIVYSDLGADCLRSGALQVAADWMDRKLFHV
jgi:predicted NBD/HSP70 family sugar kinase